MIIVFHKTVNLKQCKQMFLVRSNRMINYSHTISIAGLYYIMFTWYVYIYALLLQWCNTIRI